MQLKHVCKMVLETMKPQLIHIAARVSFREGGGICPPWLLLAPLDMLRILFYMYQL